MIDEIRRLKERYPVYREIDDQTIADGLARKYPAYSHLPDLVRKDTDRFTVPGMGEVNFGIDPNRPDADTLTKQRDELKAQALEAGRAEWGAEEPPVGYPVRHEPTPDRSTVGSVFGETARRTERRFQESADAFFGIPQAARRLGEAAVSITMPPLRPRKPSQALSELGTGAMELLSGVSAPFNQLIAPVGAAFEQAAAGGFGTSEQAARIVGGLGEAATGIGMGLLGAAGKLTPFGMLLNEIIGVTPARRPGGLIQPGDLPARMDAPPGLTAQTFDVEFPSDIGAGPARRSAEAFEEGMQQLERTRQGPAGREGLLRDLEAEFFAKRQPQPAIIPEPMPTGTAGVPPMPPIRTNIPTPPIRMGTGQRLLGAPEADDVLLVADVVRQRIEKGEPFTPEQIALVRRTAGGELGPVNRDTETFLNGVIRRYGPAEPRAAIELPEAPIGAPPRPPTAQEAPPTPAPRGRQRLEDTEVAVSTFVNRHGGLKIPKNLREEFGGWNRLNNPKTGLAPDKMAEQAFNAGLIERPDTNALIDGLKSGRKSIQAGRASPLDPIIADIRAQNNETTLLELANRPENAVSGRANRDAVQSAAFARLKELGVDVGEPLQQVNGELKDILVGQFGARRAYTAGEIEKALQIKRAVDQQGVLAQKPIPAKMSVKELKQVSGEAEEAGFQLGRPPPAFQSTPAGQQGMIPGAEGRAVPQGPLRPGARQTEALTPLEQAGIPDTQMPLRSAPDDAIASFIDHPKPAAVAESVLPKFTEADLETGIKQARQSNKIDALATLEHEKAQRMQGRRPENLDPLDDLDAMEKDARVFNSIFDKVKNDERGVFNLSFGARGNSMVQDIHNFGKQWGEAVPDLANIELRNGMGKLIRRATSAQELANIHPELKPIYDAYHDYPRAAINNMKADLQPLFYRPPTQTGQAYFELADASRQNVDNWAIHSRNARQGMPRMTPQELANRGLNGDEVNAYNDVLDYGERLLGRYRQAYVDRKLPAMVARGQNPAAARIQLEADAQQALHGLDHWVPFYRRGDMTITVRDQNNQVRNFQMVHNARERAAVAQDLRAQFPASQGFRIEKGTLEEFVKSKAFDQIDLASLEILSRFARIDPQVANEFITGIRPELMKRSKALERQLHAGGTPGFQTDLREGLISTGNTAHHYIERAKAHDAATEALGQIDPSKRELVNFAQRFIDEQSMPGIKWLQKVRNGVYFHWLAGNLKQFVVQLTQLPTVVYPRLTAFVNDVDATRFLGSGFKTAFSDLTKQTPETQTAIRELFNLGVYQSRAEMFQGKVAEHVPALKNPVTQLPEFQLEEAIGRMTRKLEPHAKFKDFRDFMMLPITDADMRGRVAASMAFYRAGRERLGMTADAAIKFAARETNRTSFLYGRGENPQLFGRGDVAMMFNMFRTWPANYFSFLRGQMNEKQWGTMARSIGAMLVLGGVKFNIPTVALNAISGALGVDPETEARRVLNGMFGTGSRITEGILRGAPAAFGIDLSRSMGLGDVFPAEVTLDVLGAPFSAAQRIATGAGQLVQGVTESPFGPSTRDALELMSPAFFRNTLRAVKVADEGIRTKRGGALPGGEAGMGSAALRLMGFTPTQESVTRAEQRAYETERAAHSARQSETLERLAKAIKNDDQKAVQSVMQKVQEHNDKALKQGRVDLFVTIDRTALRQRVAEMIIPEAAMKRTPRTMRPRRQELQETYLGPPAPPQE